MYAVALSLGAFISTFAGGLFAASFRSRAGAITAFSASVLIAVPIFDLLPESLALAADLGIPATTPFNSVALGFIFLYVMERYFSVHHVCEGGVCKNIRHPKGGIYGAIELAAHSFVEGFAIGVGFHVDFRVGLVVAAAVISHDFSDGINAVTIMLSAGNSRRSALRMLILDATAPVLGALSAQVFVFPEPILVLLLPFLSGGFLYLGASDLLPESPSK